MAPERVYIRQGDLPEGGRSRNFDHGGLEAGVSCYRGLRHEDGSYEVLPGGVDLAIHFSAFREQGRPAYAVEGTQVGHGTEGEPVLEVERATKIEQGNYPLMATWWEAAALLVKGGFYGDYHPPDDAIAAKVLRMRGLR